MKILIADDDGVWVRVLARFLQGAGHEALAASTWGGARLLADRDLPDAILMDSALPDGDAKDFCAQLRTDRRFDRTALVLLSGVGGAACEGADSCLLKGEPMASLAAGISAAAEARRAAGGK